MTDLRELRRLEPWFYRAPSAHNAQPWVLDYDPERIELGFDPRRHLEAGDPSRRDLFLSLGAFVEAVLVAAAAEGIPLDFAADVDVDGARVGAFALAAHPYATPFGLAELERRATSRLPYEPRRLSERELAPARGQLNPGEQLHELPAGEIADLFAAADRWFYESPPIVAELRSWLRLSRRDPRYERDGLTYDCLALSRVEARLVGLLLRPSVYPLVRRVRLHRAFTASATSLLRREGSVLVLSGRANSAAGLVAAGRSLHRAWLALAGAGCYTHPLSQIVDCAPTEAELRTRLGLERGERPLSVFRAGRSEPPSRSRRLVA